MPLTIKQNGNHLLDCSTAIIVPDIAIAEPGHIRCLAQNQTGQSKHEFHALAQTACYQNDDKDLAPKHCSGPVQISTADETLVLDSGLLICRTPEGSLGIITNSDRPLRKLLETALRLCTRWVRLDI